MTRSRLLGLISFIILLLLVTGVWKLVYGQASPGYTKIGSVPAIGCSPSCTFTTPTLTDGAAYNVEVTAVNAAGESGPSPVLTGVVPSTGTHTGTVTITPSSSGSPATSFNIYDQVVTIPNPPGATLTIN